MKLVKGLAVLSIAVSMCITGCLSNSPSDNLLKKNQNATEGVDENLTKEDASFFSKSGAVACATGAVVGILACLNAKDKLACAIAAGAAGCAVAMTGNYVLDKVRENYKNTEDQLDATKAIAEDGIKSTKELYTGIQETMKEDQAEIKQLQKDIKKGKKTQADLENRVVQMDKNIAFIRDRIEKTDKTLTDIKNTRDELSKDVAQKGPNSKAAKNLKELDGKIAELTKTKSDLESALIDYSNKVDHTKKQIGA